MAKTRQASSGRRRPRWPDGSVAIRTFPVTFLSDQIQDRRDADWHVVAFATRGNLEVVTGDVRRLVPADHAVWLPAGTPYTNVMRAPISMRSLFVAARLAPRATRIRTIAVAPLLRELILHATRLGALDRRDPIQARLAAVLLDQLAAAADVAFVLRTPQDPRARRFAELVTAAPGDPRPIAALARAAGTSLRTLERCFLAETGLPAGEWRRRVRLFHALHRLERGEPVTEVAFDAGYATPSAFSTAFKRQFGVTPGRTRGTTRQGAMTMPPA